jgi:hypothetical protein
LINRTTGRRGAATAAQKAEQEKEKQKRNEQIQMDALERMATTVVPLDFDLKAQRIQIFGE